MESNTFTHNIGCIKEVTGAVRIHCSTTPEDVYAQAEFFHNFYGADSDQTLTHQTYAGIYNIISYLIY